MRHIILLLVAFSLSLPHASAQSPLKSPIKLPIIQCGIYFVLPLSIRSKTTNTTATLNMLLDTGAYESFLDPDAFERITGKNVKSRTYTKISKSSIGAFKIGRRYVHLTEFDSIELVMGTRIDGILGFSVFENTMLTLDYTKGEIFVSRGHISAPNGIDIFSTSGPDDRPWLNTRLGDKKLKLLMDTAAGEMLVLSSLKNVDTHTLAVPATVSQGVNGTDISLSTRAKANLTFGKHTINEPIVSVIPGENIFSAQLMKNYRLTFDTKNKRVQITNPLGITPEMPSQQRSGALIAPVDGKLRILEVSPSSPAAVAGLQAGDTIESIDGKKPERRGCDLHSIPENSILTFKRKDAEFTHTMKREILVK
ncbi:PDZ domain-containing protein [Kordiimonas laminariae]|uniref:PDZ domain-containing protein n=1 Tax=Kordiimonas laminariae TaxID=2917717 RepID=UPI001FF1CE50|nr:PDZ domain-containing protein [Kordiimonas laminariae]MCK0069571.1 PDZ domain-containing protein [Kordiimonas laminariae]